MKFFKLSTLIVLFTVSTPVFAGGAYIINNNGDPILWQNSASDRIEIHPESGSCGQFSNSEMLTRLANNLEEWTSLGTLDLGFTIVSGTVGAVNGDNYTDFLVGMGGNTSQQNIDNSQDGINPILFDDDGEISDGATGESNGRFTLLGFASPDSFTADPSDSSLITAIVGGQGVFNCYCLEDESGDPAHSDCSSPFLVDDLDFTMVHEMGHIINLDHTQINANLHNDGDDANDDFLPTMFPVAVSAANQKTPMEDDIVAISSNYPTSTFFTASNATSAYCRVTGTLLDRFGEDMRCVDLQFTVSGDPFYNVAFVSGAYAPAVDNNGDNDTADDEECTSDCGDFVFYLDPDKSYTLATNDINSSFVGGSGISPCANGQLPECTALNISRCTDGDESTSCQSCVVTETLSTNTSNSSIASLIESQCTAGATVNLGNILSNSISGVTAGSGTASGGSALSACGLNTQTGRSHSSMLAITTFVLVLGLLSLRFRRQNF